MYGQLRVAIVTRPVGRDERYNFLGRAVAAGERFFVCTRPTYGSVDTDHGIALTEQADGGYPFFEFPLSAVVVVDGSEAFCASCGWLGSPGVHDLDCPHDVSECQAKVPVRDGGVLLAWVICGQPATAVNSYRCSRGHARQGATCPAHLPAPGEVGCAQCLAEGHECPMEVTE